MLFRQQKSTFKKVQEIENFPKGLVHGFWPKIAIFLNGGFWPNPARKERFLIFGIEKTFQNAHKIEIFQRGY